MKKETLWVSFFVAYSCGIATDNPEAGSEKAIYAPALEGMASISQTGMGVSVLIRTAGDPE